MAARYDNWRDEYQSRLKTMEQALEAIEEGDLVSITILCPAPLVAAFVERAKKLGRVDFRTLAPGNPDLFNPEAIGGEKEIEIFIGDAMRPAHDARIATYLPNTFMLGMKAFDAGREEARMPDVFLTPCSPPNEQGYVHFGPHLWQRKSYAKRCKKTIAIVDPNLSPVFGDVWMHVSEIDAFIEGVIKPVDIPAIVERINTMSNEADRPAFIDVRHTVGLADPITDADTIVERLSRRIELVIDAGGQGFVPTTVIDLTGAEPLIVRLGCGSVQDMIGRGAQESVLRVRF